MTELKLDGQTIEYLNPKRVDSQLPYEFRVDGLAEGESITSYGFLVNGQEFSLSNPMVDGLLFVRTDFNLSDGVLLELAQGTLNATYLITFWYSTPYVARHSQSVKLPVRKV